MSQYCEFVPRFNPIPHKPVLYGPDTHPGLRTDTNIVKGNLMEGLGAPSVYESAKIENFHQAF